MPSEPNDQSKDFVCQFCRRRFRRFEHQKRHERLHTNEQPYPCLRCEKRFTRKDLLNRHITTKHSHTTPDAVPPNFQPATTPVPAEERQARDTLIDPLWDLPLSQLQFNDYVPLLDCVDTDLTLSDQDQSLWSNVLDFSLANNIRPGVSTQIGPVENMRQWSGMGNDASNAETFADYPSVLVANSLNVVRPARHPMTSMDTEQNDQVSNCLNSSNVLEAQHTVASSSYLSAADSNLDYESFPLKTTPRLWNLEPNIVHKLNSQRVELSAVIPSSFTIPPRALLSKYIYLFEKRYLAHFPILHTATFKAECGPLDLILSIAALGSSFCHDEENAVKMLAVAREVTLERLRRRRKAFEENMEGVLYRDSDAARMNSLEARKDSLQILQALVMQVNLSCLLDLHSGLSQVNELKTSLANSLRDCQLTQSAGMHSSSWEEWIAWEGTKRAIYVSFSVLNLAAILASHPPVFMNYEIEIELPCAEAEWQCATQEEWRAMHTSSRPTELFQTVLRQLLDNTDSVDRQHHSTFSNHVLLLALLQHFHLLRQLDVRSSNDVDLYYDTSSHYITLAKWRRMWESCAESSLDPFSSYGSLAFTSAMLYHTAFVHNILDLGKMNVLDDANPATTASKLLDFQPVCRSPRTVQVVMHAVCVLDISLKFGFNHSASDKSPVSTLEFAMCALECCILLTKWVSAVNTACLSSERSQDEQKVLEILSELLEGTAPTVLGDRSGIVRVDELDKISARVAKTWANLFSGATTRLLVRLRTVIDCYGDLLATI